MDPLFDHAVAIGIWLVVAIVILILIRMANVFRYIPNNQVGIVEKLWAPKGAIKSGFIALHGAVTLVHHGKPRRRRVAERQVEITRTAEVVRLASRGADRRQRRQERLLADAVDDTGCRAATE